MNRLMQWLSKPTYKQTVKRIQVIQEHMEEVGRRPAMVDRLKKELDILESLIYGHPLRKIEAQEFLKLLDEGNKKRTHEESC